MQLSYLGWRQVNLSAKGYQFRGEGRPITYFEAYLVVTRKQVGSLFQVKKGQSMERRNHKLLTKSVCDLKKKLLLLRKCFSIEKHKGLSFPKDKERSNTNTFHKLKQTLQVRSNSDSKGFLKEKKTLCVVLSFKKATRKTRASASVFFRRSCFQQRSLLSTKVVF